MKDLLIVLCLVLGTLLILAQVVLAFVPKAAIQVTGSDEVQIQSIGDKLLDAAGKFADKAPLMGGGILLFILAAILTGDISVAASAESK